MDKLKTHDRMCYKMNTCGSCDVEVYRSSAAVRDRWSASGSRLETTSVTNRSVMPGEARSTRSKALRSSWIDCDGVAWRALSCNTNE